MGLTLTALIEAAMGSVEPAYAAEVSGILSTAQQVGNALSVALVGMVFFGTVGSGYAHAMTCSLVYLAGTTIGVALLGVRLARGMGRPTDTEDDADEGLVMVGG
jgi:hypothetical protein